MGALAQDEAVTWDNPQVFFVFQSNGKTFDVTSLSRSVHLVNTDGTYTEEIASGALDLTDAPTGTRIAQGIYHADFAATGWDPGTYEIRWTYVTPEDPDALIIAPGTFETRQRFEVVDKNKFYRGAAYVGYADSVELMKFSPFDIQQVGDVQVLINRASRKIEDLTSRFFEPRYMKYRVNGRGVPGLQLSEPIVGVSKLEIESGANGLTMTLTEVSLDGVRVGARHLQGILDPDDRDNPRIEITRFEGILFQTLSTFPKGPQTIHVTGVFGYTNPNGGPFGKTPEDLTQIVGNFATKMLSDPFGLDLALQIPGTLMSAKTRDQSVTYRGTHNIGLPTLTGDPIVDLVLIKYVRPFHLGAV